jgi:hypothetical protein
MRRTPFFAALAIALAGCAPPPYEQTGGVGFGTAADYQAQREAELASSARPGLGNPYPLAGAGAPVTTLPGSTGAYAATGAQPLPAEVYAAVDAANGVAPVAPAPAPAPLPAAAAGTAPLPLPAGGSTGISDEQDFNAVAARESIETDRARIEQNRAQYQEIAPTALPERGGAGASPIIEYAINAPNRLGEAIYSRSGLALGNHDKACARYASPADAQEAFLNAGGPRRDSRNLDPDGDGFACSWDPTPFQKVRG